MANKPDSEIPSSPAPATSARAGGAAASEPAAERVGVITGLRLCIRCGFNLTGQTIVREPAYGLLIARCPECGTVAPLQEYPPLGAWQRRWAILLAALWFAAVLAMVYATIHLPQSTTQVVSWQMNPPLIKHIGKAWQPVVMDAMEAVRANDGSEEALSRTMISIAQQYISWYDSGQYTDAIIQQWIDQGNTGIDPQWWKDNRAAVLATAPPLGLDWLRTLPLTTWLPKLLIAAALGALWAIILLHVRLRRRLTFATIIIIAAAGFTVWSRPTLGNAAWIGWQANAWTLAQHESWFAAGAAAMILFAVPFLLGLIFGRPLARLVARALLPPRACQAIAPLWFCDGKEPPRVRTPR